FLDALSVREKIFVGEQKAVPLTHHTDTNNARSYPQTLPPPKPIGTIRLIPSPHPAHPAPGSIYDASPGEEVPARSAEEVFFAADPIYETGKRTSFHDGEEPYVKLGRLCVVAEERGRRIADVLIQGSLEWARENPGAVARMCGDGGGEWRGLVCVHAQEGAVRMWERNGFVVDREMGGVGGGGKEAFGVVEEA
ncbi:hypothetical protein LSUB1_G008467, partial [Lachnellula subtilissima]